jgi:transcription antitermination factor NusG
VTLKQARLEDRDFAGAPAAKKFEPITSAAVSVTELQPNVWLLVLADHSVWRTDDDVRFEPKAGDIVKVTKGAFGSFLANIGRERAVRVKPLH